MTFVGLLPNVGAEEPCSSSAARTFGRPLRSAVGGLWELLFRAHPVRLDDGPRLLWPFPAANRPAEAVWPSLEALGPGIAWLPTPPSESELRARGFPPGQPSAPAVLRTHDKAFALEAARAAGLIPRTLNGLLVAFDPIDLTQEDFAAELFERVRAWPAWTAGSFTLKPRFGSSGRGRVPGLASRPNDPVLRGALSRLAAARGAVLEPWLARVADYSAAGFVSPDGAVEHWGCFTQRLLRSGEYRGHSGWVSPEGVSSSGSPHDETLRDTLERAARLAAEHGFWGPCGIDAFTFRVSTSDSSLQFRPLVEFNARFTLGSLVAGLLRRAADAGWLTHREPPGRDQPYRFRLAGTRTGNEPDDDGAVRKALDVRLEDGTTAAVLELLEPPASASSPAGS